MSGLTKPCAGSVHQQFLAIYKLLLADFMPASMIVLTFYGDWQVVESQENAYREVALMAMLTVNGRSMEVDCPADMPLLWVLRDVLGLTGTKFGCGIAQCGACTVHMDGRPVRSCVLAVGTIGARVITTIEGIGEQPNGAKIQKAWLDLEVIQCGYCQSGQIMAATALLNRVQHPDDSDIDAALAGNLCRCGTYVRIREAIKHASAHA